MEVSHNQNNGLTSFAGRKIWITGHKGMLGAALVRSFEFEGAQLLLCSRQELDLTDQKRVYEWVEFNKPELIFHVGAKVGGIYANASSPADFIYANLMIEANVIDAAYRFGVKKLIFVASNCTYPSKTSQPIPESAILSGDLDDNIRSYAVGKIAGIELCRAYRKQYGCSFVSVILLTYMVRGIITIHNIAMWLRESCAVPTRQKSLAQANLPFGGMVRHGEKYCMWTI